MEKDITKKYSNGEVTIVWKPGICIHSTLCFKGLPEVFDPRKRPWVSPENSSTQSIIEQVRKCPSGALSYYLNEVNIEQKEESTGVIIEISPDGPLLVQGGFRLKDTTGSLIEKSNTTALCRCGSSANKPFCDGSHRKIGFKG
jgi:uncharacterized Fe-S cluster protein YjdI